MELKQEQAQMDELNRKIDQARSEGVGLEYEQNDLSEDIIRDNSDEKPFDAEKIRVDQQMLSVKYMLELMENKLIDLDPEYQRNKVWQDSKRKSLLIESLMLRIPIPAFYFYEQQDGKYQVIDGQQRLFTIQEFINGSFKLTGLEYLGEKYDKKGFSDLEMKYVQRIYRTQIAVNVLDARSPRRVIYDIFRRVNTGGVHLNPQEMRNAICQHDVRVLLRNSTKNNNYLLATRGKISDIRMDSQELALRFYAFYMIYDYLNDEVQYTSSGIASLLDEAVDKLADMPENKKREMYTLFDTAMKRCYAAFGEYCFSKLQIDENGQYTRSRDYINRSLFSAFSVLLMHPKYDGIDLSLFREKLLLELAHKLQDHGYVAAITNATGDKRNVLMNFKYSKEVLNCV